MKTRQEIIARRPWEVISSAKQIALSRGSRIESETGTEVEIRTGISARSLGETIKVTAVDNPSAPGSSLVTVGSSVRLQVYDWGKSGDNIDVIMSALREVPGFVPAAPISASSSGPGQTQVRAQPSIDPNRKFCANCGKSMPVKARFCPGCGQPRQTRELPNLLL